MKMVAEKLLILVVCVFCYCCSIRLVQCEQGYEISFTAKGTDYPAHDIVDFQDFGESNGLGCRVMICCGSHNNIQNTACMCSNVTINWYHPNGVFVRNREHKDGFGVERFGNALFLYRKSESNTHKHQGVWRCRVNDTSGVEQNSYIGAYLREEGGMIKVNQNYLSFSNNEGSTFNLTLVTSGGPVTYFAWLKDGVQIVNHSIPKSINTFCATRTVLTLKQGQHSKYIYHNTLTVTGSHTGVYKIRVYNNRIQQNSAIEKSVTIMAMESLSLNITLSRNGVNSLRVSWSAPRMSPGLTRYRITNKNCTRPSTMPSKCEATCTHSNSNCMSEVEATTMITAIQVGGNNPDQEYHYLSPLSVDSSSVFSEVQIDDYTVSTQLLSATSVSVTLTSNDRGLSPAERTLLYQYSVHVEFNGTAGECSTLHGTEDVNKTRDGHNSVILNGLEEFSTYNIMIRAPNNELIDDSNPFTTYSSAPSGPPRNLTIANMTTTSITITWESVECIHRNGLITQYNIIYGPLNNWTERNTTVTTSNLQTSDENSFTFIVNIHNVPYQQYVFRVAAININGTGPYSDEIQTVEGVHAPLNVSTQLVNATSVLVTWTHPDQGLSVDEYIVSYQRINGTDGQCSTEQDEGNVSVNKSTRSHALLGFKGYSVYKINVTASNTLYRTTSDPTSSESETNSTAPSGPPRNLAISNQNETSITFTWKSVKCIERNGFITHYVIQYGVINAENSELMKKTLSTHKDEGGNYKIMVTDRSSLYTFKVAAQNNDGVGPYAEINTTERTSGSSGQMSGSVTAIIGGVVPLVLLIALISFIAGGLILFRKQVKTKAVIPSSAKHNPDTINMSTMEIQPYVYEPTLDLQTGATIKEFPGNIQVIAGQEVTMKAVLNGQPKPSLTWYHNGEKLVADYSLEIDQDGRVYIPSSELRHNGVYKLVIKNDHGSDEREMNLVVQHEYEQIPQKDVDITPIPVSEFGTFVAKHHENMNKGFTDLFQSLYEGKDHTKNIGLSPANKKLNRFGNITVYDDNRIPLKSDTKFVNTFINACYMDGYLCPKKYIATQGPLPKTVNDFWRLVWQEKVPTIVMVTNLKENNKEKCQQYWPDSGSLQCGPVEVTVTEKQILADYVIRTFLINLVDNEDPSQTQKVVQYHFTSWPDHGVPAYATSVLAYHRRIKAEHKPRAKRGPMLVHCSAGVGRTGTFIAIDWVLEQVEKEKSVDIAGTVNKMRQQRMKMVQTVEQLVFIHDAILESVTCGNTQINVADLRSVVMKMLRRDPKTNKTAFELHWDVLEQVSPDPKQNYCSTAIKFPELNRKTEYLPSEKYRVVLKGEHPDYIHATNVNGYKQKNAYIIAEGPMESTLRNFWKMICGKKCGTIIMLSDLIENGEESCYKYWPNSSKEALRLKDQTVELVQEQVCNGYTVRKLRVTVTKKPPHEVMQFHITNWGVDGKCSAFSSVIEVIEEMTRVQMRSGNKPIVVHCSDTVGRSGMFCAVSSAIEQCKSEGVVDVFQVIKAMRVQKPGAVFNVQQYQLIFDAIMTYMDSFETYANFQNI